MFSRVDLRHWPGDSVLLLWAVLLDTAAVVDCSNKGLQVTMQRNPLFPLFQVFLLSERKIISNNCSLSNGGETVFPSQNLKMDPKISWGFFSINYVNYGFFNIVILYRHWVENGTTDYSTVLINQYQLLNITDNQTTLILY